MESKSLRTAHERYCALKAFEVELVWVQSRGDGIQKCRFAPLHASHWRLLIVTNNPMILGMLH